MRFILALCVIANLCTLVAFVLDLIGPKQKHMMVTRRNGMLNIMSVFLLVTVCGMCYWASQLLYQTQHSHKRATGSKVVVKFGISYYIVVGSAVANIFAAACNLLRRYPPREEPTEDRAQLIYNDVDHVILMPDDPVALQITRNDPPPYTP